MFPQKLLSVGVLAVAMILSGCSTHAVRCDRKLSPINAPAPASKATNAQAMEATP